MSPHKLPVATPSCSRTPFTREPAGASVVIVDVACRGVAPAPVGATVNSRPLLSPTCQDRSSASRTAEAQPLPAHLPSPQLIEPLPLHRSSKCLDTSEGSSRRLSVRRCFRKNFQRWRRSLTIFAAKPMWPFYISGTSLSSGYN